MTREDFLEIINKIVEPSTPLKEESLISDCDEIDSLSLLSIFLEAKKQEFSVALLILLNVFQ